MKIRDKKYERLDALGQALLKASSISGNEIERIVEAPGLFDLLHARIAGEAGERTSQKRGSSGWWNWQMRLAACGILAIVMLTAIGLSFYSGGELPLAAAVPPVRTETDRIVDPSSYTLPPSSLIDVPAVRDHRSGILLASKRSAKSDRPRPMQRVEEVSDFYPLTYTDDQYSNNDGGQIVRVELPRSSLTAMGVEVPENRAENVKTDLLIGSDGVMKAVRFVK